MWVRACVEEGGMVGMASDVAGLSVGCVRDCVCVCVVEEVEVKVWMSTD